MRAILNTFSIENITKFHLEHDLQEIRIYGINNIRTILIQSHTVVGHGRANQQRKWQNE